MNILEKRRRLDRRKARVRVTVRGTPSRPRLSVFRSNNHIYAQIIDDANGRTVVAASSCDPGLRGRLKAGGILRQLSRLGFCWRNEPKQFQSMASFLIGVEGFIMGVSNL